MPSGKSAKSSEYSQDDDFKTEESKPNKKVLNNALEMNEHVKPGEAKIDNSIKMENSEKVCLNRFAYLHFLFFNK